VALVVVAELAAVEVCLEVGVPHLLVSDDGRVCHQLLLHLHFDEREVDVTPKSVMSRPAEHSSCASVLIAFMRFRRACSTVFAEASRPQRRSVTLTHLLLRSV
jgi:hypothetical protein